MQMIVTPQLSAEIQRLLPKTQEELAKTLQDVAAVIPAEEQGGLVESVLFSIGDISLIIKRADKFVW